MSFPIRTSSERDSQSDTDDFDEIQYSRPTGVSNIRTLKPPPEIWELVHPVTEQKFTPGKALTARLATKNVFMLIVAILLASGIGATSWKLHIPQKILAVFREPDAPAKKMAPLTIRSNGADRSRSTPVTVTSTSATGVTGPNSFSSPTDEVQPGAVATKRPISKTVKPKNDSTNKPTDSVPAQGTDASAISRPRVVSRTKEQQRSVAQNSSGNGTGPIKNSDPSGAGSSRPKGGTDNSSSKPKETRSVSSSEEAAPKTTSTKPKVIQWP